MKWRWEGDMKATLGAFLAGFIGSYMVLPSAGLSSSPVIGAAAGAYLGLTAWIIMFAVENLKSSTKEK